MLVFHGSDRCFFPTVGAVDSIFVKLGSRWLIKINVSCAAENMTFECWMRIVFIHKICLSSMWTVQAQTRRTACNRIQNKQHLQSQTHGPSQTLHLPDWLIGFHTNIWTQTGSFFYLPTQDDWKLHTSNPDEVKILHWATVRLANTSFWLPHILLRDESTKGRSNRTDV